jgi:exosortase E/protease (VPEID-CTERM system)
LSSGSFVQRILFLAFVFVSEAILVSLWLDGASLAPRSGLIGIMHTWGAWILRGAVGFPVIFLTFAYLRNKSALDRISGEIEQTPVRWSLFAAHCAAMGSFAGLSFLIYTRGGLGAEANLLAAGWFAAGISAIGLAGLAILSWTIWVQLIRSTGYLWAYSLLAIVSACAGGNVVRGLWRPASYLTFRLTKLFLSPFVSGIVANPATLVISTQRFHVKIAPECSGLEGVGLILAFGILWLLVFRRECHFPRALLLLPLGVTLLFVLNSIRIAALIFIGNAGARQIALGGFHSQAGWIAFSAVGVGFCFAAQHVPWFTKRQQSWELPGAVTHNPTAVFLLPFLMILASGMIVSAANASKGPGSFEWLYPLRFFAVAGMLWVFRRSYARMSWRCGWLAPVIGAIVFVIWVGLDRFSNPGPLVDRGVSGELMAFSTAARVAWISFRVLAAIVTVPLAEELAFRGFLMRRLISADFDSVSLSRFSWFALLASSAAFGLLHSGYWIAGSIAGILFGLAVIRRGRIGDAVAAHATANAMLAVYVLRYHQWHLW